MFAFLTSILNTLRRWLGLSSPEPTSASALLSEMKAERRGSNPEWKKLNNRFATLVFSESDRQRLWKRAHRTEPTSARLLSGITSPSPEELRVLRALIKELEEGR